jgi:hypothetical protein
MPGGKSGLSPARCPFVSLFSSFLLLSVVENENHYYFLSIDGNIRIISITIRHLAAKKDEGKSP